MIRLSKCEYHFSFPTKLKNIKFTVEDLRSYHNNEALRTVLAKQHKVSKEQVRIFAGSIEALRVAFQAAQGGSIGLPEYTWAQYHAIVKDLRMSYVIYKIKENERTFHYDIDDIIRVGNKCAVLLIPSPNNPTGNVISAKNLEKVLQAIKIPVFIDAAHIGFAREQISYDTLVKRFPHLTIIYSFSKYYGLPALRCGYMICGEKINVEERYLFGLHPEMQKIAVMALQEKKFFAKIAEDCYKIKKWFSKELEQFGKSYDVEANYALLEVSQEQQKEYVSALRKKDIEIKSISHNGRHYLRIDVAPKPVLEKVLHILRRSNVTQHKNL